MALEQVIMAVIASVVYSMSVYLKRLPTDKAEAFDWMKIIATSVVAILIGLLAGGVVPTEASIEAQLAMYGGMTMLVQNALLTVWRGVQKYLPQ